MCYVFSAEEGKKIELKPENKNQGLAMREKRLLCIIYKQNTIADKMRAPLKTQWEG
jgi:hypothetical protein